MVGVWRWRRALTASVFVALSILLISHIVYRDLSYKGLDSDSSLRKTPKALRVAKYSKTPESDGDVWMADTHWVRRRRRHAHTNRSRHTRGVARQCGSACSIRLRGQDAEQGVHLVHLHVFRQLPVPHNKSLHNYSNGAIVPLVQWMESENATRASLATASPDCIYRARVHGVSESSIVNLCDTHGALFGLLALPDGVYSVEPLHDDSEESSTEGSRRHVHHLLHKFKPHHFKKQYDFDPVEENHENLTYTDIRWEDTQERHRRSRRSATSWDHYVEVFVVADAKMYEYHGRDLESYVLTLFSTVASIYRHPSLRASINIVVVKILILQHEYSGPRITYNAQESLQNFCRWQTAYNDRSEDSVNHYDVAILLTRKDICRGPGKCDTLGLAELGTMCEWDKSCAIIEDNGLSAAFTIAHELAHLFNIPHDDERKCGEWMPLTKQHFHIMAPTLEYNTHPWSWSACSAAMLERFLERRAHTECLFDQPIERRYYDDMFEMEAPGTTYDVNRQCQFVFGPQAALCPYMPSCRRLWCSLTVGVQLGCRTQHMPWADGTPCDKNGQMQCYRGECVGMSTARSKKIDGAWGEWGPWGQCSRSCAGGVQKAIRDCDKPKPANGGKYCVGVRERYRSCNVGECPWDTPPFREVQCAEFNNKDVGIHGVPPSTQWVPKYEVAENERCKLYCRVSGISAFYLLKNKVIDGTPCDRNSDDICVDGVCRRAGCDHVLDSPLKRDKCGICGGDGTGCRVVKGTYNERGSFGYNEVMKIPAGSANIDIRQHGYNGVKDDDNYLSLRSANGDFLLNGHYQVSVFRQHIPVQDVVLEYSGSDSVIERINGTGPLRSDIYVHVLSVGNLNPPDIRYEYMTALPTGHSVYAAGTATLQQQYHHFWRIGEQWTQCSSVCQGEQRLDYVCVEASSNRQANARSCEAVRAPPPPQTRACNTDCTLRWHTEDTSQCSVKCGTGEKTQRVMCVKTDAHGRLTPTAESDCDTSSRPSERAICVIDCSGRGGHWIYSQWTECSASCGQSGVSKRNVFCVDMHSRHIDPALCDMRLRETAERPCNRVACPRWSYGPWSECTKSCDGGIRRRHSMCVDGEEREVPAHHCHSPSRLDYEKCNEDECTWWHFGEWGPCSARCGQGNATRTAVCTTKNGPTSPARCDARQRIVSKECSAPEACPRWAVGQWTPCPQRCGEQWSTRRVVCSVGESRTVKDSECLNSVGPKPDTHRECPSGPCPFWREYPFSSCSVSCGVGMRTRRVVCVLRDDEVDDSFCQAVKPSLVEQCSLLECAEWVASPWSACSVSCGAGNQTRNLSCVAGGKPVETLQCDPKSRPRTWKQCMRDSCVAPLPLGQQNAPTEQPKPRFWWATGTWTECSVKCGKGTQRRLVKCRDAIRDLPEAYCAHLDKIESEQVCQIRVCARWQPGPWRPCPSPCGQHVSQEREVKCVAIDARENATETDCDIAERPPQSRECNLPRCAENEPAMGIWITQPWGQCSVSCGGGWRSRTVSCSTPRCNQRRRPSDAERCMNIRCPTPTQTPASSRFTWQIPPWTHCSTTCGIGVQRRNVWCEEEATRRQVSDTRCARDARPVETKACERPPCPSTRPSTAPLPPENNETRWSAGTWSSCSSPCGRGLRRRVVLCLDAKNRTVEDKRCTGQPPVREHRCRLKPCARWRGLPWAECSVTCGEGIRKRKVVCKRGRKITVDNSECVGMKRPAETAVCKADPCPVYSWNASPWTKCGDPCGGGEQTRVVHCMNHGEMKAADRMCANSTRPPERRACPLNLCPYEWVPGPWNSCSKTCGNGTQLRTMECRLKVEHNVPIQRGSNSKSSGSRPKLVESVVPKEKCEKLSMPSTSQTCVVNICGADFQWHLEPWTHCSTTCGAGIRRRKVRCQTKTGGRADRERCAALTPRPNRTQNCFVRNCFPSTCQEIKAMNSGTHALDGEYTVLLDGFAIRVYCHRMNETIPRAYITVNEESNYAEVYGKRLTSPHTCPHNGERNDTCDCTKDGAAEAGLTRFYRLRVDLLNRRINGLDFSFAKTEHGLPVQYATAGDCYSMKDCPQGRFSMDLRGTGIRIIDDVQWEDRGHRTTSRIDRTHNNARIQGQCGGYCGKCAPDRFRGLIFAIDPQQVTTGT